MSEIHSYRYWRFCRYHWKNYRPNCHFNRVRTHIYHTPFHIYYTVPSGRWTLCSFSQSGNLSICSVLLSFKVAQILLVFLVEMCVNDPKHSWIEQTLLCLPCIHLSFYTRLGRQCTRPWPALLFAHTAASGWCPGSSTGRPRSLQFQQTSCCDPWAEYEHRLKT